MVQDGVAMAAKMIHNAERSGKKVTRSATGRRGEISAGNIAYYTIVKLRNGCRSSGMVTGDVYGDEATRVTRQRPIFQLALRPRTDADHFVEKNEMVGNRMAALRAGFAGFGDGGAYRLDRGIEYKKTLPQRGAKSAKQGSFSCAF